MDRNKVGLVAGVAVLVLVFLSGVVWLLGSSNPHTPAGYVGYLTQGAVFGKAKFYGLQVGPTSPGRTWRLRVTNVSITPYTYTEDFSGPETVLAKGNLNIGFRVHLVFRLKENRIKEFVEKYSYLNQGKEDGEDTPDNIFKVAYDNYVKEPLRTAARDEVQKHEGLQVKDNITTIGAAVEKRIQAVTVDTPFEVSSVVVGNIQYPPEVTTAVSKKMAATQELEQRDTMIQIARKDAEKRIIEANGIAKAMDIIQSKLTPLYIQHEAIEAQKLMVDSPNHTTVYIPVGNNGVPLVGNLDISNKPAGAKEAGKK